MEEHDKIEEHKHEEKETHHHKKDITNKMRENLWMVSTFVLGIIVIIFLLSSFFGFSLTGKVSKQQAGENLVQYLSVAGYDGFTVNSVEDSNGFYLIDTSYKGEDVPFYITKNGYIVGNQLISIIPQEDALSQTPDLTQNIPKSDKPSVTLFVMTHCPYGTQAEKGIIPAIKELGDTVDAKIRFVHYFMHEPEKNETPRQVCIREEQPEKWYSYLECFLEDGDSERCVTKFGINKIKLNTCVNSGKWEDYYNEDSELSQNLGVQGSPTLIINGQEASSARDSQSYLDTICFAFNAVPENCLTELSSTAPSAGFGTGTASSSTSASCS